MSKKDIFLLTVVIAFTGAIVWFIHNEVGDWAIIGKVFGFHVVATILGLAFIAGMLVLIRKLALKRLDAYVQHLRKEGYDAPGIDAYEAHLFTFCLFYATVMTTASIWLWYEIYTKSAFVLIIFTVFTTPVGLAAAWFSTKTWRTVSARLKQYCNALDEGSTINLPRIRK